MAAILLPDAAAVLMAVCIPVHRHAPCPVRRPVPPHARPIARRHRLRPTARRLPLSRFIRLMVLRVPPDQPEQQAQQVQQDRQAHAARRVPMA